MRDYRVWWALFVFFAALGVLVVQGRYRLWRRAKAASSVEPQRVRREGWRLVMMTTSLVVMTGLVFGALLGAPPALLLILRLLAIGSVLGLVLLSLRL